MIESNSLHSSLWRFGLSTALCVLGIACEETAENYTPPPSDGTAANGGSAGSVGSAGAAGNQNTANSAGTGGSAGTDSAAPGVDSENTLLSLNDDIAGWTVAYAQPTSLVAPVAASPIADAGAPGDAGGSDAGVSAGDAAVSPDPAPEPSSEVDPQYASVSHDSTTGDPVAGSMRINVPFNPEELPPAADPFYKVGVELQFEQIQDWSTKRALQIRARLNDGVFSSVDTPPQIKIYIRTGPVGEPGVYANFGFNLEDAARNTWQTYSFTLNAPAYVDTAAGDLDLASVSTVGIEIASGAGTVVEPGTIHVDSFVLADFVN